MAVLIPLFFYVIANQYGVALPKRYFPDSVITKMKDGKEITDTIWHKVNDLHLQNQLLLNLLETTKSKKILM